MGAQRALAAIVFTDAVDFSSRTNRDEAGTFALLERDLEVMRQLALTHQGQVLKSLGDGLLLVFGSAVQAVAFSLDVQAQLAIQRAASEDGHLLHRLGIHVGDVMLSEDDAQGDGVNVARRLQESAEPGGIRISGTVYEVVRSRLALDARDQGHPILKGIETPIRVYEISPHVSTPAIPPARKPSQSKPAVPIALTVLGVVAIATYLSVSSRSSQIGPSQTRNTGLVASTTSGASDPGKSVLAEPAGKSRTVNLTEDEINAIATRLAKQMMEEARKGSKSDPVGDRVQTARATSEPIPTPPSAKDEKSPQSTPPSPQANLSTRKASQPTATPPLPPGPARKSVDQNSPASPSSPKIQLIDRLPIPEEAVNELKGVLGPNGTQRFEAQVRRINMKSGQMGDFRGLESLRDSGRSDSARVRAASRLPGFDAVRETALKSYDFEAIVEWLQQQPETPGKGELIRHYRSLSDLRGWLTKELREHTQSSPVRIDTQLSELAVWAEGDQLKFSTGRGTGALKWKSVRPEVFRLLALACVGETEDPVSRLSLIRRFEREYGIGMPGGAPRIFPGADRPIPNLRDRTKNRPAPAGPPDLSLK